MAKIAPLPQMLPGTLGLMDADVWNEVASLLEALRGLQGVGGVTVSWSAGIPIINGAAGGDDFVKVKFGAPTSVFSFYLGTIYSGTPTGPFPAGLTAGAPCYIQNLNEYNLGEWPTPVGDPGIGYNDGTFTDPATAVQLQLITVDHVATGGCS